jgi:triosephosphate isomerase
MRQLIAGNWKMHGLIAEAEVLARGIAAGVAGLGCDVAVFPAATALAAVARALQGSAVGVGGQNCHAEPSGAHTGDISAEQLRDAGAGWVILGHSERRGDHGETDISVRAKVLAAQRVGLVPIVCVGETREQRVGRGETEAVGWQISGSLPKDFAGVVAYEPVWAIGTGRLPTHEEVAAMHAFMREEMVRELGEASRGIPILYGGSVNPENAAGLLGLPEVGGALVGGASLKAEAFLAIAREAVAGA